MSAGSVSAVGDVYDLVGGRVWYVSLLITGDRRAAEQATIHTFTTAWRSAASLPTDPAAARRWLVRTASSVSRELTLVDGSGSRPGRMSGNEPDHSP